MSSLLATHQFFASLALRMEFEEGDVPDLSGDGRNFAYNAEWVAESTIDEIKGCIAHIVYACALKHHTRRGGRDFAKWNTASRMATFDMLKQNEFWTPDGVTGMDWPIEKIYDFLPDPPEGPDGAPSPDAGAGAAAPSEGASEGNSGEGGGSGGQGNGPQDAGSDSGSAPQSGQAPGQVRDAPKEEQDQQEKEWDRATKQAAQSAKAAGRDPGDVLQEFEDIHQARRDWEDLLAEYMRASAPTDFSWSWPNRRYIDGGLYLPSMRGEGMGPVVFAIDTSGSVDDNQVNLDFSNIIEVVKTLNPERVIVIQCDAQVRDVMEFDPADPPASIEIKGRGGTAFQPVFDKIEELDCAPDVMIYMTDLYGPHPQEPDYPVIWAVENDGQAENAPFGATVVINNDHQET